MKRYKSVLGIGNIKYDLTKSLLNDRDFYKDVEYEKVVLDEVFRKVSKNVPLRISDNEYLSSSVSTTRDKKIKFDISLLNTRVNNLTKHSNFLTEYTDSYLESSGDLQKSLDSEIKELEIKYLENADKVHVNSFSKEKDKISYNNSCIFRTNFKTFMPFKGTDLMESFFGIGMTFPVQSIEKYDVSDCIILDEKTCVGDTSAKIYSKENVFDIFRKEKIFRYAIVKSSKDTSSRAYKRKTSYNEYPYNLTPTLTLELKLESYVSMNYLKISPVSLEGFSLKTLKYENEGNIYEIDINEKKLHNKYYVFFKTFSANKIILELEQTTCIENAKVIVSEKDNFYLNESLRISGFLSRVEEEYEEITGYVYDLSLRNIEIGKISFKDTGMIYSKKIDVENFLSSKTNVSAISFGDDFFVENYLGVFLKNEEDNIVVQDLLPLPDSNTYQEEYLAIREDYARVKLYPDLKNNLNKEKITIERSSLTTNVDDEILFNTFHYDRLILDYEKLSHNLVEDQNSDNFTVQLIDVEYNDHILTIGNDLLLKITRIDYDEQNGYKYHFKAVSGNDNTLNESDLPGILNKYEYCIYEYDSESLFFEVFEDEKLLVLGKDYRYSLDKRNSWNIEKPNVKYFYRNIKEKIAGNFYIELNEPKNDKLYSIKYKIDQKQNLTKGIDLINEKISIDKKYQDNYGYIQNIILCKNSIKDSEEICLIEEYNNIIFENDLKEKKSKKIDLLKVNLDKRKKRTR